MKKFYLLLSLFILMLPHYSCKKNTSCDLNPNVNSSNDVILSLSSYTTIFNLIIKARLDSSITHLGYGAVEGAQVLYNSTLNEYQFLFNNLCPDSVLRSGVINVKVTGDLLQQGSFARVYFENYYEDFGKVNGTDSIANEGVNSSGQMVWSMHVSGGNINKAYGGGEISLDINATFKVAVNDLSYGSDIVFLVKGNMAGISSKGYEFHASVRDTLRDSFSCPWIKDGIVDLHIPGSEIPDGTINFMSESGCSDVFWYYFGNSSFRIHKNKEFLKN